MTPSVEAWSFLVGRSQYHGHQTIVAPRFMCEANKSEDVAAFVTTHGQPTEEGTVLCRHVYATTTFPQNLTLIYRVAFADSTMIGGTENSPLYDKATRPILLTMGVAIRGHFHADTVNWRLFSELEDQLRSGYQAFWLDRSPVFVAHCSDAMLVENATGGDEVLRVVTVDPYSPDPTPASESSNFAQNVEPPVIPVPRADSHISPLALLALGGAVLAVVGGAIKLFTR